MFADFVFKQKGNNCLADWEFDESAAQNCFERGTTINQNSERETGFEPATIGLEGQCSTNLSYSRVVSELLQRFAVRQK